jgi:hypothetical protein
MIGVGALVQIDLDDRTVRLSVDGWFTFGGEQFLPTDPELGTIIALQYGEDGAGDVLSPLEIAFAPPAPLAASVLNVAALKRSRVQAWVVNYNAETGAILESQRRFLGHVAQPSVKSARNEYTVSLLCQPMSAAALAANRGNGLNAAFHKRMFPGELGHDEASGLSQGKAWGTFRAPKGTVNSSPVFRPGFGGGDFDANDRALL